MRWTEIQAYAAERDIPLPTYRQMDLWTREAHSCGRKDGTHKRGCVIKTPARLRTEFKGDRHGQYRDWPDGEWQVALTVARLLSVDFGVDLAFRLARAQPATDGSRQLTLDDFRKPLIRVGLDAE
jgi:hypothetical protein